VAPPGKVLLELDYKQAEVYMAAVYCDDPNMWADLASGDFHRRTAAYVNKCAESDVTTWQRTKAKNSTFGKFFLIGANKFAKQNSISLDEAHTYMREWDARYPRYQSYVKDCYNEVCRTGELVTITERKRRYPCAGAIGDTSIMPETTNFKIQSTSHDCLMSAIVEAYPVAASLDAHIVLDIHDAMLIEAWQHNWKEVAYRVRDVMRKPRFPGLPSLPVEVKVGPTWGELEEVHLSD
jgi:DNA polymerase-1